MMRGCFGEPLVHVFGGLFSEPNVGGGVGIQKDGRVNGLSLADIELQFSVSGLSNTQGGDGTGTDLGLYRNSASAFSMVNALAGTC